jgi:hypothetical protein
MRRSLAVACLLGLSTCATVRSIQAQEAVTLQMVRQIRDELRWVCGRTGFDVTCGDVLVDLASFRTALATVDSAAATAPFDTLFGARVRDLPHSEAYSCGDRREIGTCRMMYEGAVHIALDSIESTDGSTAVWVTVSWRKRRPGIHQYRFDFRRNGTSVDLVGLKLEQAT